MTSSYSYLYLGKRTQKIDFGDETAPSDAVAGSYEIKQSARCPI
jgi:hypothetical protein